MSKYIEVPNYVIPSHFIEIKGYNQTSAQNTTVLVKKVNQMDTYTDLHSWIEQHKMLYNDKNNVKSIVRPVNMGNKDFGKIIEAIKGWVK